MNNPPTHAERCIIGHEEEAFDKRSLMSKRFYLLEKGTVSFKIVLLVILLNWYSGSWISSLFTRICSNLRCSPALITVSSTGREKFMVFQCSRSRHQTQSFIYKYCLKVMPMITKRNLRVVILFKLLCISLWKSPARFWTVKIAEFLLRTVIYFFLTQGGLNKYHGTHALRERARKLHEGILIVR